MKHSERLLDMAVEAEKLYKLSPFGDPYSQVAFADMNYYLREASKMEKTGD